ncbi:hypothetical protein IGS67_00600 [Flavimobilis sp. GY10621]|uniref:Uncharacterized protein n=1 Tax=Flavimobilis rhizosphaerae TaxID=2775421 RepID=A0ABR9DLH6_9MICO|nr:hypothetical protein [Flavimobilis rhizosphaerae]MBD9697999.1 hypothetical protein [Flavimobilis rhizosphaerae]
MTKRGRRGARHSRGLSQWWRKRVAVLGALLLAFSGILGAANVAIAALPGIAIDLLHNGQVAADGHEVETGQNVQLRVSYDAEQLAGGESIVVSLPSGIDLNGALPDNSAIESVTDHGNGTYTVLFKNPKPVGVTEGAFAFTFRAANESGEGGSRITWELGGETHGVTIVVKDREVTPGEPYSHWNGHNKGVNSSANLSDFVTMGVDNGDIVFTGLDSDIEDAVLTYTLTIDSKEARPAGYTVNDALSAGLSYGTGFQATLTTFDTDGVADAGTPIAFVPAVTGTSPQSFTGTLPALPQNSRVTITYTAAVTDTAALEALLRAKFNELGGAPGSFGISLSNTATFGGGDPRTASVYVGGNVAGVGVGDEQFAKLQSWNQQTLYIGDDGAVDDLDTMTYTLRANLSAWDGRNANFTLSRNVVIQDTLIDQAEWLDGEAGFLVVRPASGSGLQTLTQATTCTTADAFASDAYIGQWCLNGQTLLINVGKNNPASQTNIEIDVRAKLNTVTGLPTGWTPIQGATAYNWSNKATFYYRAGDATDRWSPGATIVDLPGSPGEGIKEDQTFNKTSQTDVVRVNPGQSAKIKYNFTIDIGRAELDITKSRIVDEVNPELFDLSDLSNVKVTGQYNYWRPLGESDFTKSVDGDGNLVVELSPSGINEVETGPSGTPQRLVVEVELTTVPLTGKETLEVYNKARLIGEAGDQIYWNEDETEATSYGDEAELRKRLIDPVTGEAAQEIEVPVKDGEFLNDEFIYSIEVIPRGNYGTAFPVQIFTRHDVLPENLTFLGFVDVDSQGVPSSTVKTETTVDLNGNIQALYDNGVVTIQQRQGTNLQTGQRIVVYFKVRATVPDGDLSNSIAGSTAVIKPVGDPSIDIEKWSDEGEEPEYSEGGTLTNDKFDGDFDAAPGKTLTAGATLPINFTISNDGHEDLVDVVVSDELTSGEGEIQDLVCTFPDESTGVSWAGPFKVGTQFDCTGTLPALEAGETHANLATVTGIGRVTREEVEDEDAWHGRVPEAGTEAPSMDIEKWSDEGEAPEYDASGALTNDKFDGDFDAAPGKTLTAGASLPINFTISNDGSEPLVDVVVSDELTGGVGAITGLVCTFPGGSTGTEWAGPFAVGTQFDCTGTLPALAAGNTHANLASVTAEGANSGVGVDDEDAWHGRVPEAPSIDIEKWSDEGEAPEYDASGALTNDKFDGDFDAAPGKTLTAGASLPINFTISNDGSEPLVDVVVSDELTGGVGAITGLVCTFPDASTGVSWAGPFAVGTQFDCTGTLPGLAAGAVHANLASVTAEGANSGVGVDDEDAWHGRVPEAPTPEPGDGPTTEPGDGPTTEPGDGPTTEPGDGPTTEPGDGPTTEPGDGPTTEPGDGPSTEPGDGPSTEPGDGPTSTPSDGSSDEPGDGPGTEPGDEPSNAPEDVPSIDIEKWSDEGSAPEYDESGALTNDGFDGDFDEEDGKQLVANTSQKINFTISNDGTEPLIDIVVSDKLTSGKGKIEGLVCTFPDRSTGTEWDGPLAVGAQFTCVGTLPALSAGDTHANTATVTAVGVDSGAGVDDADDWAAFVPSDGDLAATGGQLGTGLIALVVLLLGGGGALLAIRRRVS